MALPPVHYLVVLVTGVVIFLLGGLWYSPVLFAKPWVRLIGKSEEELKAAAGNMPLSYLLVFLCGLVTAWVMAVLANHFPPYTAVRGALLGALCWLGFAGATSYATVIFSGVPRKLWLINSGYNLVSFVLAGIILMLCR